ncbi:MAG: hypothetical protein AAFV53_03750 [Myxococcota bacterium]
MRTWWAGLLGVILGGCSDAELYQRGQEDLSADRVGFSGEVCTNDAREAGFPVKVVLLMDTAASAAMSEFDPELSRLRALQETISVHSGAGFEFSVIRYGSRSEVLAPTDAWFSTNPGDLQRAVSVLSLQEGCLNGVCRDYEAGLSLAQSVIEGDMVDQTAGSKLRTQYVVVMIAAGPPEPLSCSYECCPADDETCPDACIEDWDCTTNTMAALAQQMREEVEAGGALSLSLHTALLAAPDIDEPDPFGTLDQTEDLLKQMAFRGGGSFSRFDVAQSFSLDYIGLLKLSSLLEVKSLLVTNRSVMPTGTGPQPDSDGDGLEDSSEASLGTDPENEDSDGDGIGDFIEEMVSLDPRTPDDPPNACLQLGEFMFTDIDIDGLNDCEEALLGTDRSLPDTDADGLLDWLEVRMGTNFLFDDALTDSDWDGVPNGEEILNHTDPRSSDATQHLTEAYRYDVSDLGRINQIIIEDPELLLGVEMGLSGQDTTGGLGKIRFEPGDPPLLSWQDPGDPALGEPVAVGERGEYTLYSSAAASEGLDRWVQIEVVPEALPTQVTEELLLVESSERQCVDFTIRNIQLEETLGTDRRGVNDVYLYLVQTPEGRPTSPGLFRAVHVPIVYREGVGREPSDPIIELDDDDFTTIGD